MNPVPSYQIVEFLSWLNENHRGIESNIGRFDLSDRNTVMRLALEYLRQGGFVESSLSSIMLIFQYCPNIRDTDLLDQMQHFTHCGHCVELFMMEYRIKHWWNISRFNLHPLLEHFILFCQEHGLSKRLDPSQYIEHYMGGGKRHWIDLDHEFHRYIHQVGYDLFLAFEKYLEEADPELVRDYELKRKEYGRRFPYIEDIKSEEGTEAISENENLEQAAVRLVNSLYMLVNSEFYDESRLELRAFKLMGETGFLPKSTAQAMEFFSWLNKKYEKIKPLGNVSTQGILELVSEFCEEREYKNIKSFSEEVKKWLKGTIDQRVLRSLRRIIAGQKGINVEVISPLERYQKVPYHAMFLFLAVDNFPEFIRKYWKDLNPMTGDWIDIYYSEEELKNRVSGFDMMNQLRSIDIRTESIPALLVWEKDISNACVIPLTQLSYDEIFCLMQRIVQKIEDKKDLKQICIEATEYVNLKEKGTMKGTKIDVHGGNVQINTGDGGINTQVISTEKWETFDDFASEVVQEINRSQLPEDTKKRLIDNTRTLVKSDTYSKTKEITKNLPSLKDKFSKFFMGIGSGLVESGIVESIKSFL